MYVSVVHSLGCNRFRGHNSNVIMTVLLLQASLCIPTLCTCTRVVSQHQQCQACDDHVVCMFILKACTWWSVFVDFDFVDCDLAEVTMFEGGK